MAFTTPKPQKPLATLGDLIPQAEKKKSAARKHETVPPLYLKKLVEALGTSAAAAKKLGLTGTSVSESIAKNRARLVTEIAAEAIYKRQYQEKADAPKAKRTAVITADPAHIKTVKDILLAVGGSFYLLPDGEGK